MATMKELVPEYRRAAAMLAMRLAEKEAIGAPALELRSLRAALQDIREAQRLMDGYYTVPRSEHLSCWALKARRTRDDG